MDKLDMKSKDIISSNIEKLKELFPCALIEEDGHTKIDFEVLKQELTNNILINKKEKFELTWPGKKEAISLSNLSTNKTLRPIKDKSLNFDDTKNIYIEGDNLEVLKILQESYLNKINCIYIDPPYNTGNDFIYNDDYSKDGMQELEDSGQIDEYGNRLITNPNSNGRFHSDWLSMMYPRLKLARNLLISTGVIFISIDDSECYNLKKICDEIFGEQNFISNFVWKSKLGKVGTTNHVSTIHEYILCYAKDISKINMKKIETTNDGRKESLRQWGVADRREDRPSMWYPITIDGITVYPYKEDGTEGRWRVGKETADELLENGKLVLEEKNGKYNIYRLFDPGTSITSYDTLLIDNIGTTAKGAAALKELDMNKLFDFSKPVELINFFIELCNFKNGIILDFFSGSATTAHATLLNNIINKNINKFILVQIPENCDQKSEALKSGYNTICEVGQERIRRAGNKIKQETNANIDYGFRVYKVDSSNMKDVFYKPSDVTQLNILDLASNIKEDRTPEDILIQVMLDLGLTLDLKIEEKHILNNNVYFVENNALIACFDDNINIDIIDEICKYNPLKVVFKDVSFKSDKDKINLEERIKKLSPETEISIL